MRNKFRNLPLQAKISSVYLLASLLMLFVNVVLLYGMNRMSKELDVVYTKNIQLNELTTHLSEVQDSMTEYLNSKTSDSLEEYYRNEQTYSQMVSELDERITEITFGRMERNIRYMSENYLESVSQTIEAKRGRNVEKYRIRYENATELYHYIITYINSLNNEQFLHNSENYIKLSEAFRFFEMVGTIAIFFVMLCNAFLIIRISGSIIRPLKELTGKADEVAKGNFEIDLLEVQSGDEIGVVTRAFNQMVLSIRQYIEKIRQSIEIERELKEKELMMEAHLKDAQLKYLQAQINPHFLFNTLNAGAQLAMMEGADRTYQYVQNMADFFRYNVKKGNDTATIKEEIELVDNYIYILNVRFSGEIEYEKKIDETLLSEEIPSMILQPIVENCVNHGIRGQADGKITLSVFGTQDLVCISIRDNGAGMKEEVIQRILEGTYRNEEHTGDSNGIGMDNVIARLKLFTEKRDVISIISEGDQRGTEVIIYLPFTD